MSIFKHSGLRALGTASVAACVLVACGGSGSSNGSLPLIHQTRSRSHLWNTPTDTTPSGAR